MNVKFTINTIDHRIIYQHSGDHFAIVIMTTHEGQVVSTFQVRPQAFWNMLQVARQNALELEQDYTIQQEIIQ